MHANPNQKHAEVHWEGVDRGEWNSDLRASRPGKVQEKQKNLIPASRGKCSRGEEVDLTRGESRSKKSNLEP